MTTVKPACTDGHPRRAWVSKRQGAATLWLEVCQECGWQLAGQLVPDHWAARGNDFQRPVTSYPLGPNDHMTAGNID